MSKIGFFFVRDDLVSLSKSVVRNRNFPNAQNVSDVYFDNVAYIR